MGGLGTVGPEFHNIKHMPMLACYVRICTKQIQHVFSTSSYIGRRWFTLSN